MDPTVHALLKDMKMNILELQAINSRKMRTLEEIKADLMADWMARGMTANPSSNIIPPVFHTSSTPPPTILQPSYTSVSTQTTPPVVHRPSYASVSIQTEPLVKIPEVATPVFIIMPPSPPPIARPPPTSSLGPILTPPPPPRC